MTRIEKERFVNADGLTVHESELVTSRHYAPGQTVILDGVRFRVHTSRLRGREKVVTVEREETFPPHLYLEPE